MIAAMARALLTALLLAIAVGPLHAEEIRDAVHFAKWRRDHEAEVKAFEDFLVASKIAAVRPLHQILRSATDWEKCNAEPYAVPPPSAQAAVVKTLQLVRELEARGAIARDAEIVSGYRPPSLAACASSKQSSAHTKSFAIDLAPSNSAAGKLCTFWKEEGAGRQMGLSQYPSGRIHLDVTKYRTWGEDCTCRTSYCQPCEKSASAGCGTPAVSAH